MFGEDGRDTIIGMFGYRTPLITSLVLIALLATHACAIVFHIYWTLWWFDIVMHVLGGIAATMLILWWYTLFLKEHDRPVTKKRLFVSALLISLVVGVLWELFEAYAGLSVPSDPIYIPDTISDLLSDISGALIAYLYAIMTFRQPHASGGEAYTIQ